MDDAQLRTVWQQRQFRPAGIHLGQTVSLFVKHNLARRVRQLGKLAEIWDEVIPEDIRPHTALESFNRGVLTVLVDSAAHRFHLQTMLTGGLKREIQARFPAALDRIKLKPGQFSALEFSGPMHRGYSTG